MSINPNVVARFDDEAKEALVKLADRFERSQTYILRNLVVQAWKMVQAQDADKLEKSNKKKKVKYVRKQT